MMNHIESLKELNRRNRELAKTDLQLAFTTFPEMILPELLPPCVVKILLVTDGRGRFTNANFGLTELWAALAVSPGPWVKFVCTRAHRRNPVGSGADIDNFRFDAHDLSQYNEIWMFGEERGANTLADAELRAISEFMDQGGGVFATGDHEDLGVVMCGRVPRVRSMRKWWWPNPGPNGEPVAPTEKNSTRLDTVAQRGTDPRVFDSQSDDVPQKIHPRLFGRSWPALLAANLLRPHQLLCGPQGTIDILPDHPHDGECYVPDDLTMSFEFDGYHIEEYPARFGKRKPPQVVAWSANATGIQEKNPGGAPPAKSFGVIGAYNGHRVKVGRVVVDATWHHFFNVNLKGILGSSHPVFSKGFYGSTAGLAAYERIKNYYRNIASYLAPRKKQTAIRLRALWMVRWDPEVWMAIRGDRLDDLEDLTGEELEHVGSVARRVLERTASVCHTREWILQSIPKKVAPIFEALIGSEEEDETPADASAGSVIAALFGLDMILGGIVYAIAARYREPTAELLRQVRISDIKEAARAGADSSLRQVGQMLDQFAEHAVQIRSEFRDLL